MQYASASPKRGGKAKKRGLSDEQVPILVLPAVTADAIQAVLAPVLDKDALLVTDGCTSYPPCAKTPAALFTSS